RHPLGFERSFFRARRSAHRGDARRLPGRSRRLRAPLSRQDCRHEARGFAFGAQRARAGRRQPKPRRELFELEWLELPDDAAARCQRAPELKNYTHYLTSIRRFRPHKLSEAEEKIVNEKDNTGRNAFGRLFSEITSALSFPLERDGKKEDLTLSETLALLHEPERELRRKAMETVYRGLAEHRDTLTFIYDTLIQDHLTMDRLRKYPDPMLERHLVNEIDADAVGKMMGVTESNYAVAHDYFRLKARLLSLPKLALYDQYAPVGKNLT